MPRIAKIVAICVSNCNECLNGINVLLFHFCNAGTGSQQGKASKGLDISISFKLQDRNKHQNQIPKEPEKAACLQISLLWLAGTARALSS